MHTGLSCTECGRSVCNSYDCCDDAARLNREGQIVCGRCAKEAWARYDVVRFYRDRPGEEQVVARNLSLAEARAHCNDPETSSSTATNPAAVRRTKRYGPWFDGYRDAR